jgi:hypothetical protein
MRLRTKVVAVVVGGVMALSAGTLVGAQAAETANNGGGPVTPPTDKAGSASPTESSFVPITPCRIVNTQNPAGKLAAGETRSYRMSGNTSDQGGAAACGIPSVATALEVTITAVSADGNGYLRSWPAGQPEPNATFLNYTKAFNAGNTGTIRVQGGLGTNLAVKAYQKATHVIIDVQGYYVPGLMAVVSSNGNLVRGNGAPSVTRMATGAYNVVFNRNVTGCAYAGGLHDPSDGTGNEGDLTAASLSSDPRGVFVQTFNEAGNAADIEFHLTVTC